MNRHLSDLVERMREYGWEQKAAGDLQEAAAGYALAGVVQIVGSNLDPGSGEREAVSRIVRAVCWDALAGNGKRAEYLAVLADPICERIVAAAESDELVGLAHEWRGDLRTVTDPSTAIEHYERAGDTYRPEHRSSAPGGVEFDDAIEGYLEFVEDRGFDVPFDPEGSIDYYHAERIEFKIEVARSLAAAGSC